MYMEYLGRTMSTKATGGKRSGAGRPKKADKLVKTAVALPPTIMQRIDEFKNSRGVTQSRNAAIIDLLNAGLNHFGK